MSEPAPFDVCGPLPRGVTVLEASAGTGKTYTSAALAARFVADGMPLERLLLVTFTRMATGDLRERVRERLVSTEAGLAGALAGAPPADDAVVALLAGGDEATVRGRRERLARALADFDAATIATTHAFCQEVLWALGTAGDGDPDERFVEDVGALRDEVVDDLYVRRFHRDGHPDFDRGQALAIAELATKNPLAPIEPSDAPADTVEAMRVRLAHRARTELGRRQRAAGVLSYDDVLSRLAATLAGPSGAAVARGLRERFDVVLVDEFQDTDPVQWEILRRAFATGETTLVLIGDPKQAIYAFRGADVHAYLQAKRDARRRWNGLGGCRAAAVHRARVGRRRRTAPPGRAPGARRPLAPGRTVVARGTVVPEAPVVVPRPADGTFDAAGALVAARPVAALGAVAVLLSPAALPVGGATARVPLGAAVPGGRPAARRRIRDGPARLSPSERCVRPRTGAAPRLARSSLVQRRFAPSEVLLSRGRQACVNPLRSRHAALRGAAFGRMRRPQARGAVRPMDSTSGHRPTKQCSAGRPEGGAAPRCGDCGGRRRRGRARSTARAAVVAPLVPPLHQEVEGGQHDQRQDRGGDEAADHDDRERAAR